jgi:hypothetical protein
MTARKACSDNEDNYMTPEKCKTAHRPLYWMLSTILGLMLCTGGATAWQMTIGDRSAKIKGDLDIYHVQMDERDKANEGRMIEIKSQLKENKEDIKREMDVRFSGINNRLDKIAEAVNKRP